MSNGTGSRRHIQWRPQTLAMVPVPLSPAGRGLSHSLAPLQTILRTASYISSKLRPPSWSHPRVHSPTSMLSTPPLCALLALASTHLLVLVGSRTYTFTTSSSPSPPAFFPCLAPGPPVCCPASRTFFPASYCMYRRSFMAAAASGSVSSSEDEED